jgi:hypothetical protein
MAGKGAAYAAARSSSVCVGCRLCRKSAARCACDAALNIARLSFFNTLIHDAIWTIPETAETENTRLYQGGLWLTRQSAANRSPPKIPC